MDKCPQCGWTASPEYIPANCPEELKTLRKFALDARLLEEWTRLKDIWTHEFPDVNIAEELRRAHEWWERKGTAKSWERLDLPRFLTNWMYRTQDRSGLKVPLLMELPEEARPRADLLQKIRLYQGKYATIGELKYQASWIGLHSFKEFLPWSTFGLDDLKAILASLEVSRALVSGSRQNQLPPAKDPCPVQNPAAAPAPKPRPQPSPSPKPQTATWDEAKPIPLSKGSEYDFPANADDVPF